MWLSRATPATTSPPATVSRSTQSSPRTASTPTARSRLTRRSRSPEVLPPVLPRAREQHAPPCDFVGGQRQAPPRVTPKPAANRAGPAACATARRARFLCLGRAQYSPLHPFSRGLCAGPVSAGFHSREIRVSPRAAVGEWRGWHPLTSGREEKSGAWGLPGQRGRPHASRQPGGEEGACVGCTPIAILWHPKMNGRLPTDETGVTGRPVQHCPHRAYHLPGGSRA